MWEQEEGWRFVGEGVGLEVCGRRSRVGGLWEQEEGWRYLGAGGGLEVCGSRRRVGGLWEQEERRRLFKNVARVQSVGYIY